MIVELWVVTPCKPIPRFSRVLTSRLRKFEGSPHEKNTSLWKLERVFEPSRMMFKELKEQNSFHRSVSAKKRQNNKH